MTRLTPGPIDVLVLVGAAVLFCVILFRLLGRRDRPPPPKPPPPPPRHRSTRRPEEPVVRVIRFILAILLFPIFFVVWAIASIENIVAGAVHLLVASLGAAFGLVIAITGSSPGREWRRASVEFRYFLRHVYEAGRRAVVYLGAGGLLDRIERGIDDARGPLPVGGRGDFDRVPPVDPVFPFEDRYRIESSLRAGGSTARLFVVRRLDGSRAVGERLVLKYFDMGLGSRLEEVIRESRGMAVAKEMGIVLDHRLEENHFYYVMPYYDGETLTRAAARLHRTLRSGEGLAPDAVEVSLDWISDVLRILDGYHRRGVIHKDVKPDNVLVTDDGVRLVDLGLLTPVESALTLTTHGTEYFRDPEMVKLAVAGKRVRDVDAARFDVYSTGAVLYFLLEGSFPACGPLSRFSRPVPMALSWITSRAMAEGDKRYPSVAAMRDDLDAARSRARAAGGYDAVAVASLPSFGGFDGRAASASPLPPMPASPREPVAYAPPRPETRREAPAVLAEAASGAPVRSRRWGASATVSMGCFLLLLLGIAGAAGLLLDRAGSGQARSAAARATELERLVVVPDQRSVHLSAEEAVTLRRHVVREVRRVREMMAKRFPDRDVAGAPLLVLAHDHCAGEVRRLPADPAFVDALGGLGELPGRAAVEARLRRQLGGVTRIRRDLALFELRRVSMSLDAPPLLVLIEPGPELSSKKVDVRLFYADVSETTSVGW